MKSIPHANRNNSAKKTGFLTKNEKLKKQNMDKISSYLIKRYNNFFKDKGYTQANLNKDIEKLIHNKDMKNFNLAIEQPKIEKTIMEKISNMESKKPCVYSLANINKLLPQHENQPNKIYSKRVNSAKRATKVPNLNKQIQKLNNNEKPIPVKENILPFNTEKVELLKQKQNDKWAIEANKNYQLYLKEEENKRKQKEENQRLHKAILEQQIQEKKQLREQEKINEENLNKNNQNYFTKEDKAVIKPVPNEEEIFGEDKENIYNGYNSKPNVINAELIEKENQKNIDMKMKNSKKQNELEMQYIKKMEEEIKKYKEEEQRKKNEQREKYILLQKENEENAKKKQMEKKRLKEEQLKIKEENNYNNYFSKNIPEKKEPDLKADLKPEITVENYYDRIKQKEKDLKEYETKKLQREMEEIKQKEDEENLQKKLKREKLLKEYQEGLKQQIEEKKKRKEESKK